MGDPHENQKCLRLSLECEGKALFLSSRYPPLFPCAGRERGGGPPVFRPKGRGRGVLIVDQSVGLNQEIFN